MGKKLLSIVCCTLALFSCATTKLGKQEAKSRKQIAELSVDWLKYKIYLMPEEEQVAGKSRHNKTKSIKLSMMIINMKNNFSPLRRLCSDINEYNLYNEYLLNGAKNEIYLISGNTINYPVFYAFENNYNAFPFETINVGYTLPKKNKKSTPMSLVFVDRVFAKDTLTFSLNPSIN